MRSKNEFLHGQSCRDPQLPPPVRITFNLDPLPKGLHKEIGFKLYHLHGNSTQRCNKEYLLNSPYTIESLISAFHGNTFTSQVKHFIQQTLDTNICDGA